MFSYFTTTKQTKNPLEEENENLKKQLEELIRSNEELKKKMEHYRQEAMVYKDLVFTYTSA